MRCSVRLFPLSVCALFLVATHSSQPGTHTVSLAGLSPPPNTPHPTQTNTKPPTTAHPIHTPHRAVTEENLDEYVGKRAFTSDRLYDGPPPPGVVMGTLAVEEPVC